MFLDLPEEIQLKILLYVVDTIHRMVNLRLVCHKWNNLLDDPDIWRTLCILKYNCSGIFDCNKAHFKNIHLLVRRFSALTEVDAKGSNALQLCIANNAANFETIVSLVEHNKNYIYQFNYLGQTSLHISSAKSEAKSLQFFLTLDNSQEFVNHTDNLGRTALHLASFNNSEKCTSLLISFGAKLLQDANGQTALHYSAKSGFSSITNIIVSAFGKSCLEIKDKFGKTPLLLATEYGKEELVKNLVEVQGADISTVDSTGRSILECAKILQRNSPKFIQWIENNQIFNPRLAMGHYPMNQSKNLPEEDRIMYRDQLKGAACTYNYGHYY